MWTHHLRRTFRQLRHHAAYTAISVIGLALGLAGALVIALFVRDELSYDRFHERAHRIYRVADAEGRLATSGALAPTLAAEIPEVEHAVRFSRRWSDVVMRRGEQAFFEDRFFFADSTVLDVFTFPLVAGDARTALDRPFTVVVTQTTARKYFGDADALGQTVHLEGPWGAHDFEVTAVAEDVPSNAHFHWDVLASFSTRRLADFRPERIQHWGYVGDHTYVLLRDDVDPRRVEAQIARVLQPHFAERPDAAARAQRTLQPLPSLYLRQPSEGAFAPTGDPRYVLIFAAVALLLLVIACINYANLATARATDRAREVGVRKAVGAGRAQLVRQFLSESVLLTLLAAVPAAGLAWAALPLVNEVTGKTLDLRAVVPFAPLLVASLVLVGFVAGGYPAFYLSRLRPTTTLKGRMLGAPRHAWVRGGLVAFQFAVVVALMVCTLVVQRQLAFVQEQRLGLDAEHVAVIDARGSIDRARYPALREALREHPGVVRVAGAGVALPTPPGRLMQSLQPEGVPPSSAAASREFTATPEFIRTLGIDLVEGDNLPERSPEASIPVLVNEAAVAAWGWEDPIGKTFPCCFSPTPVVVGVVKDFNYESLKERVEPLVIMGLRSTSFIYVRLRPQNLTETLAHLDETWDAFGPGTPLDLTFLDARFDALYKADRRLATVFSVFSALAILLACLGLFGLVAFSAQQRAKEVGIRKALGATTPGLVLLLSRQFAPLVLGGLLIGLPVAYFAASTWLEGFASHIALGPAVFLVAGSAACGLALLTTGLQAYRAARAAPVDTLRSE